MNSDNKPRWERAVDLGCGTGMRFFYASSSSSSILCSLLDFTGQATEQLKPFQEVIGIDPSSVMLDKARASLSRSLRASTTETKFQYIQGSAEKLSRTTLQPESVDLITAGMTFEIENHFQNLPKSIIIIL